MSSPKISAIAAISKNLVLGKNNDLVFKIPDDQKRFKGLTSGHPIIMGRKTFESVGRPLPNRTNIVITKNSDFKAEGCTVVHTLYEALIEAKKYEREEIFIIGGGQIYTEALPVTDKLYLTIVDKEVEGDTFFPSYDEFKKIVSKADHEWNGLKYSFVDLER